jgi:hypothetical protein
MIDYKTQELELNGVPRLGITLDLYPDTTFVIGGIEFIEEQDRLKIKYRYDIIEGTTPENIQIFEAAIGEFIRYYIQENPDKLIYHGGT